MAWFKNKRTRDYCLFLGLATIYIWHQTQSVYGGDAGDLVSAAYVGGIAHPPGYPIYVILGNLLSRLAFSTVAWRVTLLSAVSMAGAGFFIYRTLVLWFRSSIPPLVATLSFSFAYIVWLFASVPEVFGLYVFFVAIFTYLATRIHLSLSRAALKKYLYLLSFLSGLALSHHHAIVFFIPSWFFLVQKRIRQEWSKIASAKTIALVLFLFLSGLLPYLHPILAAKNQAPVFWNRPDTLSGFIRLITRAEYGSFIVGHFVAKDAYYRFGQLLNFFETIFYDFAVLGVFLIFLGFIYLFFRRRDLFYFTCLSIGIGGLFFSFYASFPIHINFVIATFERFLLPTYLLLTIPLTAGLIAIIHLFEKVFSYLSFKTSFAHRLATLSTLLFFLYPLKLIWVNSPKILPLKSDFTAEHMADDILSTVPQGGIVALSDDTYLFDTQYVYFTNPIYQDRFLFHLDKLTKPEHRQQLAKQFPSLTFPESNLKGYDYLRLFVETNNDNHPFFANDTFELPPAFEWVHIGILKRVYRKTNSPDIPEIEKQNELLWLKYHDPSQSKVLFDHHLLLRDVLRVYGNGHRKLGEIYLDNNNEDKAQEHLLKAYNLEPWWWANHLFLGMLKEKQKNCKEAENHWQIVLKEVPQEMETYSLLSTLYKTCFHDDVKAEAIEKERQQLLQKGELPLKSL